MAYDGVISIADQIRKRQTDEFILFEPKLTNTIIFKTNDYIITEFELQVEKNNSGIFAPITGIYINANATIAGSRMRIPSDEVHEGIRVAFDNVADMTRLKFKVWNTKHNAWGHLNEIWIMYLPNIALDWGKDVDVIINNGGSPQEVPPEPEEGVTVAPGQGE